MNAPRVIGIASGKGGVGKTTVSVNLAVALAQRNRNVMLLDADLGLANAQIALGAHASHNLSHVLSGEKQLSEIVIQTRQGVRLVPGASGVREMADLSNVQIAEIIRAFDTLDEPVDDLIVDVAAGLSGSVIDFMAACQYRVVVLCDDPSSVADAYGLIKVMATEQQLDNIYLVPNRVESAADGRKLHQRLNDVCARFLGCTVSYLGSIEADELVLHSLRKFQAVTEAAPGSAAARDFRALAATAGSLPAAAVPSGRLQFFMGRMLQPSPGR
jgi:flagellar biosynthesis protein FlhG